MDRKEKAERTELLANSLTTISRDFYTVTCLGGAPLLNQQSVKTIEQSCRLNEKEAIEVLRDRILAMELNIALAKRTLTLYDDEPTDSEGE